MRSSFRTKAWLATLCACVVAVCCIAQTKPTSGNPQREFLGKLVAAAIERTNHSVKYVSAYVPLPYPGGDVPADTGVCSDEIIRAYRAVGVDLQKEVHEDMAANFAAYPRKWGRHEPDPN